MNDGACATRSDQVLRARGLRPVGEAGGSAPGVRPQPLKTRDLMTTVTVRVCSCSRLMSM